MSTPDRRARVGSNPAKPAAPWPGWLQDAVRAGLGATAAQGWQDLGVNPGAARQARPSPAARGRQASARVPSQYPAGVPRDSASRFSGPPDKAPIRDVYSSDQRQLERADATARAGLHGVTNAPGQGAPLPAPAAQKAWENSAIERDAREAGEAANKARYEQKMGYLFKENLPATSDPTQDAYWQRADMAAWANANQGLARQKGWTPERSVAPPAAVPDYSGAAPSVANAAFAPGAASLAPALNAPDFRADRADFAPQAWAPNAPALARPFQSAPLPAPSEGVTPAAFGAGEQLAATPDIAGARSRVAAAFAQSPGNELQWTPEQMNEWAWKQGFDVRPLMQR